MHCYLIYSDISPEILLQILICRSNRPEVFLGKGALKICSKFTGEHPCRSLISKQRNCDCKVTLLNYTSVWVFFCKFAEYLQNTFS